MSHLKNHKIATPLHVQVIESKRLYKDIILKNYDLYVTFNNQTKMLSKCSITSKLYLTLTNKSLTYQILSTCNILLQKLHSRNIM